MTLYKQGVMQAILFRVFGLLLNENQQGLPEVWADTSPCHREMVDNFADPEWL